MKNEKDFHISIKWEDTLNPLQKMLHHDSSPTNIWLLLLTAGIIFILDLMSPWGVAYEVSYILVIFLSLRHQQTQILIWTTIGCSTLTILASVFSPAGGELLSIVINRALALFAFWTTTLLGLHQLEQAEGTIINPVGISQDMPAFKGTQEDLLLTDRVFMESPNHISILGQDYRHHRINLAYQAAHKKSSQEILGKSVADLFGEEIFTELLKPRLDRCFQGEEVYYESWITFPDDQRRYMNVSYLPLRTHNEPIQEIVVFSQDLTDRKNAETALQRSEDEFRDLYESAPLAYFSASLDGHITRVNHRACELLGYSREELVGKPVLELYAPTKEGYAKAATLQKKAQAGISIHDEELEMIRKDGVVIWISLSVVLIFDESGHIIERRGMVQDISARKKIEHELQASEYRFRSLVEAAGSLIIGLTPEGWIVEWNREAERFYGRTREEVLDTNYFELFIQESDRLSIMAMIKNVLEGEPIRDFQYEVINKDKEMRLISWNIDCLLNENEEPYGIICIGRDVTEWNKAQAQLEKWATVFQHTQWGVAVGNVHSQTLDMVNEAYARMHGYTVEELQGKPIAQVFAPESREQLSQNIRIIHEQGFHSFEALHIRKNGSTFPALLTVFSIKDSQDEVLYRVANVIDISNIKQTETALQKSTHLYQSLVQSIEGIVWECDFPSYQFTFVSEQATRLSGYSPEEWYRNPQFLQDFIHPNDRDWTIDFCFQASIRGDNHTLEYRVLHANGKVLWVRDTISVIAEGGQIVKLRGIMMDITQQKQAEEAIATSEKFVLGTIDALTAHICVLDEHGTILMVNDAWKKFANTHGASIDQVGIGTSYLAVSNINIQSSDGGTMRLSSEILDILNGKGTKLSFEYLLTESQWFFCKMTAFTVNGVRRLVVSHIDISEIKRAEEAIRRHNVELEAKVQQRTQRIKELEQRRMQVEKLAALAQIAAGVAHEINNPLASISQSLTLLKRALPQHHPHFRYMAKVEDCIERISQITSHLYQLYRPSSPTPSKLDVRIPIHNAVEIMKGPSSQHRVELAVAELPVSVLSVVPRNEMIQVLCNLIQNAIDTSQPFDTVEVTANTESDRVKIHVIDHGHGISPDVASRIFEPFFSTKQGKTDGGMGLGLSISHSLIEAMGGTLDFSTTIGHGSQFTITLPCTTQNGGQPT